MASKEFVAVSFSPNQLIDEDTLDQMNNNLVYLRDQAIDGKYQHLNGGATDKGIKMLCGRAVIAPRKGDTAKQRVNFARMFTPDSVPVITTSITSTHQTRIFETIAGIGRVHPNHQGFEVTVNVAAEKEKNDKISRKIYINWIAMGY